MPPKSCLTTNMYDYLTLTIYIMITLKANQKAKAELGKLFQLTVKLDRRLEMFSDYLDEAWHQLLQNKKEYEKFCIASCNHVIKHIDSSIPGASGYGEISWIQDYEQHFGKLEKEWFMDSSGEINDILYQNYLKTGKVIAAWKCNPKK